MLVVHPTGAYKGHTVNGLVCLTFPKSPTQFLTSRDCLTNQKRAGKTRQRPPALTVTKGNFAVARDCSIYFIQAGKGGPIKVGNALDVRQRLNTLQVASPEKLTLLHSMSGTPELEKAYHKEWAEHRLRGEWFRPARDILLFISRNKYRRGKGVHAHHLEMQELLGQTPHLGSVRP